MFEAQAALAVNPMARRLAPTGDGGIRENQVGYKAASFLAWDLGTQFHR